MVSFTVERTQAEALREKGTEEILWTNKERGSNRSAEKPEYWKHA